MADLNSYIPHHMREESIPGLAIALIYDGRVAWTEGFGVANTFTRDPVTPDTVFEVASNSKVVAAYIALQLVDEGSMSLDEPLNAYLAEPWLPQSEYRDAITLRHVLSHSSGLGHMSLDRESLFAPGRGYSYSSVGFEYLQAVIEEIESRALYDVAPDAVFTPLQMSSSSFVAAPELRDRTSNGHIRLIAPVTVFAVLYVFALVVAGALGLSILRLRTGHWRLAWRQALAIAGAALIVACLLGFALREAANLPGFGWLVSLVGSVSAAVYLSLFVTGVFVVRRVVPRRTGFLAASTAIWSVLLAVGLLAMANRVPNVPVPRSTRVSASAASSARATAGDMARFLIELSNPRFLSSETAEQLRTPQVALSRDLSWGLGPGIQHGSQGDALWQWGQQLHFQSVMTVYPEHGFGVLVLTNSDILSPDVAIDVAHRALGGELAPIRRASHMQFNYRDGEPSGDQ